MNDWILPKTQAELDAIRKGKQGKKQAKKRTTFSKEELEPNYVLIDAALWKTDINAILLNLEASIMKGGLIKNILTKFANMSNINFVLIIIVSLTFFPNKCKAQNTSAYSCKDLYTAIETNDTLFISGYLNTNDPRSACNKLIITELIIKYERYGLIDLLECSSEMLYLVLKDYPDKVDKTLSLITGKKSIDVGHKEQYQSYTIAQKFILYGVNLEDFMRNHESRLNFFIDCVRNSNYKVLNLLNFQDQALYSGNCYGETVFTVAVADRNIKMIKYLLENGVQDACGISLCDDSAYPEDYCENGYQVALSNKDSCIVDLFIRYSDKNK